MEDTKKNEMWGKVMAPLAGFLAIVLVAFLMPTSLTLYISLFFAFHPEAAFLFLIHKFIIHKKDEIYFYISPFDYA